MAWISINTRQRAEGVLKVDEGMCIYRFSPQSTRRAQSFIGVRRRSSVYRAVRVKSKDSLVNGKHQIVFVQNRLYNGVDMRKVHMHGYKDLDSGILSERSIVWFT
jgi:hypothetical protein